MEDHEFRRILDLFPLVRSRHFCFQDDSGRASSSRLAQDEVTEWQKGWFEMDKIDELDENEGAFWSKLRAAAEKKVGPANAERFCSAFKAAHKKLVFKELNLEAAARFVNVAPN